MVQSPTDGSQEILQVDCFEYDPDTDKFTTRYQRYFRLGADWHTRERTEAYYWEIDIDFPSDDMFPR